MSDSEEIEKRIRWFARNFGTEGLIMLAAALLGTFSGHNYREIFKEIYYALKEEKTKE